MLSLIVFFTTPIAPQVHHLLERPEGQNIDIISSAAISYGLTFNMILDY